MSSAQSSLSIFAQKYFHENKRNFQNQTLGLFMQVIQNTNDLLYYVLVLCLLKHSKGNMKPCVSIEQHLSFLWEPFKFGFALVKNSFDANFLNRTICLDCWLFNIYYTHTLIDNVLCIAVKKEYFSKICSSWWLLLKQRSRVSFCHANKNWKIDNGTCDNVPAFSPE